MSEFERLAVIEVGTKGIRLLVVQRREPPVGMESWRPAATWATSAKAWTRMRAG